MNIIVIAKTYHAKSSARAIQMRRVIASLKKYTNHQIILITEGARYLDTKNDNLQIVNIPDTKSNFPVIEKVFDRLICSLFCLTESDFVRNTLNIAEQLIQKNKIHLILTVSTPFDSHLAGLKLKQTNPDLKWITFFSDLWPTILLPPPYRRKKLLSQKELSKMKEVVEKCDILLAPSAYTLDFIKKRINTNTVLKTVQHCASDQIQQNNGGFEGYIIHAGFLSKERIREDLIDAVNELYAEEHKFKGIIHIGPYHSSLKKMIQAKNCKSFFLVGSLPENLAKAIQTMTNISLIIEAPMGDTSPFLPSKVTDCIAYNKKIISISPAKSFLSDFSKVNNGLFFCNYDKVEIKECIKKALQSNYSVNQKARDYFNPQNISKRYCDIFDLVHFKK